jgi:prevent-host-death family protein
MSEVGIRALKQNASAVVADAAAGEMVTITDRGRPVAQMVPVAESRVEALVGAEQARPALRSLRDLPAPSHRPRGRPTLSEAHEQMRKDERY